MPKFVLKAKFKVDNIAQIHVDNVDDYKWQLKAKCTNCGTETKNDLFVAACDAVPQPHGPNTINCLFRCSFCKREITIDVLKETYTPIKIVNENHFAPLIVFDVRGGELVSWNPQHFVAHGCTEEENDVLLGTKFVVDFSSSEFADYDEARDCEVVIYSMESMFEKIK